MMWLEVITNNSATYVHVIMLKRRGKKKKEGRNRGTSKTQAASEFSLDEPIL